MPKPNTLDILAAMSDDWNATSGALMDNVVAVLLARPPVSLTLDEPGPVTQAVFTLSVNEMREVSEKYEITRDIVQADGDTKWTVAIRLKDEPTLGRSY
jgi:hypothetical protein